MGELRVAITGFGGLDNPEPGIGVARALRSGWRGPIELVALAYSAWDTGIWSQGLVDRAELMPALRDGEHALWNALQAIHRSTPLDAIIPCLDLEIPIYTRLAPRLAQMGIRTLLPDEVSLAAVDKCQLAVTCDSLDIPSPRTLHVPNPGDAAYYAGQFGFPLYVKGTVAGARKVSDPSEVTFRAAELNAKWGGGVLLQQALEGEEFVVAMVARDDGSCAGMLPMRKLGISPSGKGVMGAVVDDPDLERQSLRILKGLRWRGPLELEFVRSRNPRRLYLVEVNNRFPSWILLSHFAGANLPVTLLKEILGRGGRRRRRPRSGAAFVRDVFETAIDQTSMRSMQAGRVRMNGRPRLRPPMGEGTEAEPLRVAVTGISSLDTVMPGLGVARALRQSGRPLRLYGLAYGAFDTGVYRDDYFHAVHTIPMENDADALFERIEELHQHMGFDVLIPTLDREIPLFSSLAHRLEGLGIHTLLPAVKSLPLCSKAKLATRWARHHWQGFSIPQGRLLRSTRALEQARHDIGYPLMLKDLRSGTFTAYDDAQALAAYKILRADNSGEPVLAQRAIHGDEFALAVVCDRQHNIVSSLAVKKLLRSAQGNTWGAVSVELPDLLHGFQKLAKALRWVGPMEAEFIRDTLTDQLMLFEINPRFPAWVGFGADIGINLPQDVIRMAMDEPLLPDTFEPGQKIFIRSCGELPVEAMQVAGFASRGSIVHE